MAFPDKQRLRQIAIRTPDPAKTAAFYKDVFGLKEVGQARTGYYLSDGYINLAILKSRDEGPGGSPLDVPGYAGIHHLGFKVDDVEAVSQKLEEAGAEPMTNRTDVRHAGPHDQEIDVTESGWVGTEADRGSRRLSGTRGRTTCSGTITTTGPQRHTWKSG